MISWRLWFICKGPSNSRLRWACRISKASRAARPGTILMAASVLVILPVIGLFFLAQRTFIAGITTTGIKG